MTENQKLREALQALLASGGVIAEATDAELMAAIDDPDAEHIVKVQAAAVLNARQALALITADHIPESGEMVADQAPNAGKMIETTPPDAQHRALKGTPCPTCSGRGDLGLPLEQTSAPDMPLSMNQFGRLVELTRDHLSANTFVYKATSKAGDTCHFGVESAAKAWAKGGTVETIKLREFKLHTSALTAPPVGEREAFEQFAQNCPMGKYNVTRRGEGYDSSHTQIMWDAWQARAAMSAGDAVDAQRTPQPHAVITGKLGTHCSFNSSELRKGDPIYTAAQIDAAMRKGQL